MFKIPIPSANGWCYFSLLGFIAFLVIMKLSRNVFQKAVRLRRRMMRATERKRIDPGGWLTGRSAMVLAASVLALLIYKTTQPEVIDFHCPEACIGVTKIEGENQFAAVNLKTGRRAEWRLCDKPAVVPGGIFPGYVIEIRFKQLTNCQQLDEPSSDLPYHIVRGKDLSSNRYAPVAANTYWDGDDRPALAKNCRNTADDKNVVCDGGEAKFIQEMAYAQPAR